MKRLLIVTVCCLLCKYSVRIRDIVIYAVHRNFWLFHIFRTEYASRLKLPLKTFSKKLWLCRLYDSFGGHNLSTIYIPSFPLVWYSAMKYGIVLYFFTAYVHYFLILKSFDFQFYDLVTFKNYKIKQRILQYKYSFKT